VSTIPRVFILCAGNQIRFGDKEPPKQLLGLKGETILGRQRRQVFERTKDYPIVVTHLDAIKTAADGIWIVPSGHRWTCETFLSTSNFWLERNVILLGDVIYSKACMDEIMSCQRDITVFGNYFEMFAVSFSEDVATKVKYRLNKAIENTKKGIGGDAKIRRFYQAYCDLPMDGNAFEPTVEEYMQHWRKYWRKVSDGYPFTDTVFHYIHDWTRDIDSKSEYVKAMQELVAQNQLDDLP
jgi:choline kinase